MKKILNLLLISFSLLSTACHQVTDWFLARQMQGEWNAYPIKKEMINARGARPYQMIDLDANPSSIYLFKDTTLLINPYSFNHESRLFKYLISGGELGIIPSCQGIAEADFSDKDSIILHEFFVVLVRNEIDKTLCKRVDMFDSELPVKVERPQIGDQANLSELPKEFVDLSIGLSKDNDSLYSYVIKDYLIDSPKDAIAELIQIANAKSQNPQNLVLNISSDVPVNLVLDIIQEVDFENLYIACVNSAPNYQPNQFLRLSKSELVWNQDSTTWERFLTNI